MEHTEFVDQAEQRAICWGVGRWVLWKNLILMCLPGTDGGPRDFTLLSWTIEDVPCMLWDCSLPLGDKHTSLLAEGPQMGRVGPFLGSHIQMTGPSLA